MLTCFVIQPFDRGPFDKRYDDVFVPAITAADLEPYRVDRDPAATIPIEEIETRIRAADACLADITEPNPNVWFEVGFAIALDKPVVLVCLERPGHTFPFDIQHRAVIRYKTESASDFEVLKTEVTARLKAALTKERRMEKIAEAAVVADVAGLSQLEMVALATIAENAEAPDSPVASLVIRRDMENQGFTKVAATVALGHLLRKEMVKVVREEDNWQNVHVSYEMRPAGVDWLIANQHLLSLRQQAQSAPLVGPLTDDDIPF